MMKNESAFFYVSPTGTEHRITRVSIIANGVRDLCIRKDTKIKKISKTKPEDIAYIPKGDILWLNIDPPFQGNPSLIQDIDDDPENMKRFVKALFKTGIKREKGKDYEMYGGSDYTTLVL